jgi:hypothetical protein
MEKAWMYGCMVSLYVVCDAWMDAWTPCLHACMRTCAMEGCTLCVALDGCHGMVGGCMRWRMHVCSDVCMHACMYVPVCIMCVCMHVCSVCMYACMYVCVRVRMFFCSHVCVCVFIDTTVHVFDLSLYIAHHHPPPLAQKLRSSSCIKLS